MSVPSRRFLSHIIAPRVLVLSATTVALLAAGACAHGGSPVPGSTAEPAPTAILGSGIGSPPAVTTAPPTTVAPTYPGSARPYAEAILAAWTGNQLTRLGQLTSAGVQEQLIEIPGPINVHWHYGRCEGAAGSSYCVFFNDPGDMITLQLTNSQLGKPNAGIGVTFDQVTFPTDPVEYVKKFVGAWQDGNTYRMKILANQTEVSYFTHYTPPDPTTSACYSGGAAGTIGVRVYNGSGLEYLILVSNAGTGKPHAITGHADPSGSNCM